MIITRIERQKRHPDRVNIHLDGEFAFGLDQEVFLRHGLRKGDAVDENLHRELLGAEECSRARSSALRYLSYRLRSEREIRTKLAEKEFADEVVDRVIEQLRSAGLIDDRRFAAAFVHDTLLRKATGGRLLRQQLLVKGVSRVLADEVIAELTGRAAERAAALNAARTLLARYRSSRKGVDDAAARRRIAQFLVRRGFAWDVITPTLRQLLSTPESEPEESDHGIDRL